MANFHIVGDVRRINRQDRIATGVLAASPPSSCSCVVSIVIYILLAGVPKLFHPSFLTGKPQQSKEGGGIGLRAVQLVLPL